MCFRRIKLYQKRNQHSCNAFLSRLSYSIIVDWIKPIKQAVQIYKLDKKAISEVATGGDSTRNAIIIVVIGGVLSGIAAGSISFVLISPLVQLLGLGITAGFYHFLARLFGGKGGSMQLFRVFGYTYIVYWLSVIPLIGSIILLLSIFWTIIVSIVVLKELYNMTTMRAVIVGLIPLIVFGGMAMLIIGITSWQMGYI